MCNRNILHCPAVESAIRLANESEQIFVDLSLLAAGATLSVDMAAITLRRNARLTYTVVSGTAADNLSLTVYVKPDVKVGGPWSGGELSPTNANPCASFSCSTPICLGALDSGQLRIKNDTAAAFPAGTSIKVKVAYAYEGDPGGPPADGEESCGTCPTTSVPVSLA